MLGAIIGDLAGSIYEFGQVKHHSNIRVKKIIEDDAFFSDDTILTVAVADAIINKRGYGETLREYALKYADQMPKNIPYFKGMFSPNFLKWAKGEMEGSSVGNGAMMRISPVGNYFETEEEVVENARLATQPSHNTQEAISCATTVALVIFHARHGLGKQEIIDRLNLEIKKPSINKFNYTCADTIDVCLYSLFTSNSFPEAIKKAIYFGGDTDTNACIVGSMAEAMFGIDDKLKRQALEKLPSEFACVAHNFYAEVGKGEVKDELNER